MKNFLYDAIGDRENAIVMAIAVVIGFTILSLKMVWLIQVIEGLF